MTKDRRRHIRKPASLAAIIHVDGQFPVPCDLVDMSQAGARLALACVFGVPQAFTLVFGSGSVSRGCVVVWRSGRELGVHFPDRG